MEEAKWYVAHTYSGYETKVKTDIEKTIVNRNLEDYILEVSVPMEEVMEIRNGKRSVVKRKLFPGYVLVHMIMNDETWYVVRNTRGVTGFVGPGSKPVPVPDEDMVIYADKPQEVTVDVAVGDPVLVTAGVWKDYRGVVNAIDMVKQTVTINVELFGRETPVEIDFKEIAKADA